jgi:hypothetical protein
VYIVHELIVELHNSLRGGAKAQTELQLTKESWYKAQL